MGELSDIVYSWSRRARLQTSLRWVGLGLAIGLFIALLPAVAARYYPLFTVWQLIVFAISVISLGIVIALLFPWLRHLRRSVLKWARHFDQQFGLKERVSTALEIESGTIKVKNDLIRKRQVVEATQIAERLDFKRLLPLKISWQQLLMALVLAIGLAAAIIMPNPQFEILEEKLRLQEELSKQVQQLEDIKKDIQASTLLTDEQKFAALQALQNAQEELKDSNATEESAFAALNDAQAQLDALKDALAEQQARDLEKAGQQLNPDELTRDLAEALSNRDFQKAADQLRNMTGQDGQALNQQQQQQLANQMEQLANSVQNSDPNLAQQLRDAAQAMREGRNQDAKNALNQAANSLDKAQQSQANQKALQQVSQSLNNQRNQLSRDQGQQQGQNGNGGQSEPSGAESGQASSEGSEGMPGEGEGEANIPSSGQAGDGSAQNSQHSEDSGSSNSVYAPQRLNEKGEVVQLPEARGQNAPNPSGRPNQAPSGSSSVPYQQVYSQYAQAADEAIQNGDVPVEMRDYVREYFSSLNPRQSK
jgi:hypothetical protein